MEITQFGLQALLEGGTTTLTVDASFLSNFNVQKSYTVNWAFLQPLLQGVSTWVSDMLAYVQQEVSNMWITLKGKALELVCSQLSQSTCYTIPAGGLIDTTIDLPFDDWISDIVLWYPSEPWEVCLPLPQSILSSCPGAGRRLADKMVKPPGGEICFEGVSRETVPAFLQEHNVEKGWTRLNTTVPRGHGRRSPDAKHTTYCFVGA